MGHLKLYLHRILEKVKIQISQILHLEDHDKTQISEDPQAFSGRKGDNLAVTFTLVNRTVAAMLFRSILDAAVVQRSSLVPCFKVLL